MVEVDEVALLVEKVMPIKQSKGVTSQVWKPLKGSEQERHRIGSLWLLLESGLRGQEQS